MRLRCSWLRRHGCGSIRPPATRVISDLAVNHWWRTSEYLYDKQENLYYRDSTYFDKREANGKKVFWGRGNGWVMGGLVRMLQYLPSNHPVAAEVREAIQGHVPPNCSPASRRTVCGAPACWIRLPIRSRKPVHPVSTPTPSHGASTRACWTARPMNPPCARHGRRWFPVSRTMAN